MSKIVLTDAATPTGISPSTTALYTKSGGAPGTDGLYYKQGADPEVGPLVVGSTVNDLQDAYDGGGAIVTNAVGGSVSISSTAVGGPDALAVTVGGSTNATGVDVTNSGPGVSVSATALGTGNAVEVEVVNSVGLLVGVFGGLATAKGIEVALTDYGSGAAGTGLSVSVDGTGPSALFEQIGNGNTLELYPTGGLAIYAEKSSTGNGIEVKMISPATGSGLKVESATTLATFPGIAVDHAGEAVGVSATMTNAVNATGFSTVVDGAGGSSAGMRIDLTDPAAAGVGLRVTMRNTATGNAIEVQDPSGPPTVFAVDVAGNTTTPSVTFNGGGTVTVRGDTGTPGDPINPRVELTSGSTNVGAVARTHFISVNINGIEDLEANATATSQQPTMIYLYSIGAGALRMIGSSRYPEGTEVLLLNRGGFGAGSVTVYNSGGSADQNLIKVEALGDTDLVIPVGTGARFLSRGTLGWTKTGTF